MDDILKINRPSAANLPLAPVFRQGHDQAFDGPVPVAVHYDNATGRFEISFSNGAAFLVPAASLQGLTEAAPDQIAEVELLGVSGLHWEALDLDLSIEGLMQGAFGTARFMEAQRKGGQSRSPAKIAASRANGAKGGRPKKRAAMPLAPDES